MTRRTNSRLAGFMFLFYIATGVISMAFFNPARNAEGTAAKLAMIAQHATLTRAAAVLAVVMMIDALVLAVALYALTRDYDRDLALLAMVFRVAEGVIGGMSIVAERAVLVIATAATGTTGPEAAAAIALGSVLLKTEGFTTLICATVFAIGSTIFCYLFLRARTIPVSLAWLGVLASVLLVIGLPLQMAGFLGGPVTSFMWIPMAAFEVTFALWLLIKGVRAQEA